MPVYTDNKGGEKLPGAKSEFGSYEYTNNLAPSLGEGLEKKREVGKKTG